MKPTRLPKEMRLMEVRLLNRLTMAIDDLQFFYQKFVDKKDASKFNIPFEESFEKWKVYRRRNNKLV